MSVHDVFDISSTMFLVFRLCSSGYGGIGLPALLLRKRAFRATLPSLLYPFSLDHNPPSRATLPALVLRKHASRATLPSLLHPFSLDHNPPSRATLPALLFRKRAFRATLPSFLV